MKINYTELLLKFFFERVEYDGRPISVTKHCVVRTNFAALEKLKNLKPAQFD
jgi:hypothetical protein